MLKVGSPVGRPFEEEIEMKVIMIGAAAFATLMLVSGAASANPQDNNAGAAMFGAMFGAAMSRAMGPPPPAVVIVPQPMYLPPSPVYDDEPGMCWLERRMVPTDWGPVPQTVRVCR